MSGDFEVWLYGSRARGNADQASDTDLLVVGSEEGVVAEAVEGLDYPRVKVSFYSWAEIEQMRVYGSLYLHHIAEEGVPLRVTGEERLGQLLDDLPRFSRAREDLEGFRAAYSEGMNSLEDGGWPDFECEVIATVARHAAILGAYCVGNPAFGREQPFWVVGEALGYDSGEIKVLVAGATGWRLHLPGAHEDERATFEWLQSVDRFLSDLEGVIDDYARVLPVTA
ncbi:MAG TPA: nucleotidyltransferase domain-containing protein [Solirubrobacterales bacterium]|nr:nucleotidyltransferase domain-containing protein [Solirubrobacterales bacterium]